jgi:hypothetical protein
MTSPCRISATTAAAGERPGRPRGAERARDLRAGRLANCGHCQSRLHHPGAVGRDDTEGYHLARFARAARRGLISATDFGAVLAAAGDRMFNGLAIVSDDVLGGR